MHLASITGLELYNETVADVDLNVSVKSDSVTPENM